MKKLLALIPAVILLSLACYLFYMQDCFVPFDIMASIKSNFSLSELTQRTWEHFNPGWKMFGLFLIPAIFGYGWWLWKPTLLRYLLPTLWVFFWANGFLNTAIAAPGIKTTLRLYPYYYSYLPSWFQFIVDYFPAIGFWR